MSWLAAHSAEVLQFVQKHSHAELGLGTVAVGIQGININEHRQLNRNVMKTQAL